MSSNRKKERFRKNSLQTHQVDLFHHIEFWLHLSFSPYCNQERLWLNETHLSMDCWLHLSCLSIFLRQNQRSSLAMVSLIECEACNHKVSELANACPQCGHPINTKDWRERVGVISDIPKKLAKRESGHPESPYKQGAITYFAMPLWIGYATFCWFTIPDTGLFLLGVTALIVWYAYFRKKPKQDGED